MDIAESILVIVTSLFQIVIINIGIPILIVKRLKKEKIKIISLVLIFSGLICLSFIVSFFSMWVFASVPWFHWLELALIPLIIYLLANKRIYSALILYKIVEIIITLWGFYGGFEIII